jgi:ribosomal protein L37AE/L43A
MASCPECAKKYVRPASHRGNLCEKCWERSQEGVFQKFASDERVKELSK